MVLGICNVRFFCLDPVNTLQLPFAATPFLEREGRRTERGRLGERDSIGWLVIPRVPTMFALAAAAPCRWHGPSCQQSDFPLAGFGRISLSCVLACSLPPLFLSLSALLSWQAPLLLGS